MSSLFRQKLFALVLSLIGVVFTGCGQADPIQEAGEAFTQGHAYSQQGHPDKAIPYYNSAIQLNPKYVAAYNERGFARRAAGDIAGSTADFNRAIELDPHHAEALCNRGWNRLSANDLPGALSDLNAAIEANPKLPEAFTNRGLVHMKRGELKDAVTDYAEAIALSPESSTAYSNRGDARNAMRDIEGAYADYTKAIELGEKHPAKNGKGTVAAAFNNRGIVEMSRNRMAEARLDFNKAIERDPKFAEAYLNRGFARASAGDPSEVKGAIADYSRAIEIDPQFATAYLRRGEAEMSPQIKDMRAALEDLERAVKISPEMALAHLSYGRALTAQRDNRAMSEFDKAISLNDRMLEAYSSRALLKQAQRDFNGAVADYSQAIEIARGAENVKSAEGAAGNNQAKESNPNLAGLLYNRGVAHRLWGDDMNLQALFGQDRGKARVYDLKKTANQQWNLAMQDFNAVAAIDPRAVAVPLIFEHRGEVKRELGDIDGAIADFSRQLEIKPDSSSAYNSRALARQAKGDDPGALEDFKHAIENDRDNAVAYANRGLLLLQLKQELRARQDFEACVQLRPELKSQLEARIKNVRSQLENQGKGEDRK